MHTNQIIGIILIKDEDIFIERVIKNIYNFCDKIIITDHQSKDKTSEIVQTIAKHKDKITYFRICHPKESHEAIEKYVGTNTWIFGVDGDEIYDPAGLEKMKQLLNKGVFDKYWLIKGNVFNCISIDYEHMNAKGYLSPPSRSMTKLYNFSIVEKWDNCTERLHAGNLKYKNDLTNYPTLELFKEANWENAYFRCLHTAFMQRSTIEAHNFTITRLNPKEKMRAIKSLENKNYIKYILKNLKAYFRLDWKNKNYKKGRLTEKNIDLFFSDY